MDEWVCRVYDGGKLEQWCTSAPNPPRVFIERVTGPKSRRKRWVIVDRRPPEKWMRALYAPKIAGPYPTLEAAQAVYLLLRASGRLE